jgi:predicted  nucleic acid-binding Zn-ribbon protein
VIADPFVQLKLLDLQAADTALSQLNHRRRTLPELALIADCDERAAATGTELVSARTELDDLAGAQRRLENDVDSVRQRAARDQQRIASAGVSAKEASGLEHEVTSLARRQSALEDELLELMESAEVAAARVEQLSGALAEIDAQRSAAEAIRDEVFAEIADAEAKWRAERDGFAASLPADLLALYEKVAAASGGVGAAMLKQRRCEGCRLDLAGNELSVVRQAKPADVLRCENCRRILIRTAESGL